MVAHHVAGAGYTDGHAENAFDFIYGEWVENADKTKRIRTVNSVCKYCKYTEEYEEEEALVAPETGVPETDAPETNTPATNAPTVTPIAKPAPKTGDNDLSIFAAMLLLAGCASVIILKKKDYIHNFYLP